MGTPTESNEVQVAARVSRSLHAKIIKRQVDAKRLTGIEPSISEVVRAMLEEAATGNGKRR
jgi:hypothetical protein